jgi:hypothetical protein
MKYAVVVALAFVAVAGCKGRDLSTPETRLWGKWRVSEHMGGVPAHAEPTVFEYYEPDGVGYTAVEGRTTRYSIKIEQVDVNENTVMFRRTRDDGAGRSLVCHLPPDGKTMKCHPMDQDRFPVTFEYEGNETYTPPQ